MKVSVEQLSQVRRRVHVVVPEEEVSGQLEKAYRRLGRTAKLKGFRPGKVPMGILKRYFAGQVQGELGLQLINDTLTEALKVSRIEAVSQPELDRGPLQEGRPFHYSFQVEVKPEITVRDYEGMPLQRRLYKISDKEVEDELEQRRRANGYLRSLEEPRPVQPGDHVVVDLQAFADGRPVPDGAVQQFHLTVGANQFNAEFESKIVGAVKGEQKEIEVTFPGDYGNDRLAGKRVTFRVDLKDIKELVLPELDDDFARDLADFETLAELRAAVRQEIDDRKSREADAELRRQILQALIERNPFEVPEAMVERELQKMIDTIRYRLGAQNLTLELAGIEEKAFKERNRSEAERKVRAFLLLEKIGDQEELQVSDEELDEGLHRAAGQIAQPYEKVRDFYSKNQMMEPLRRQLREEKVIKFLTDRAIITEVEEESGGARQTVNSERG